MILFPFRVILTVCSSKIALHPASCNFPIDTTEMCERPVSKCDSLPSAVKWVNGSVHTVFDGILFPYDEETKSV